MNAYARMNKLLYMIWYSFMQYPKIVFLLLSCIMIQNISWFWNHYIKLSKVSVSYNTRRKLISMDFFTCILLTSYLIFARFLCSNRFLIRIFRKKLMSNKKSKTLEDGSIFRQQYHKSVFLYFIAVTCFALETLFC